MGSERLSREALTAMEGHQIVSTTRFDTGTRYVGRVEKNLLSWLCGLLNVLSSSINTIDASSSEAP